jgi:mannose-6-phosphate isomerase-like protein (cupin superfamily)
MNATGGKSLKVVRENEGTQFNVMGAVMSYKVMAEDTGGAYSFALETTPPHGGLPPHIHHREDEAMFILEGEYEIHCGDKTIRATSGTFVFLPRDVSNAYQNVGDKPGKFVHITSPGGFEKVVEETSRIPMPPDMKEVVATAKRHGIDFV